MAEGKKKVVVYADWLKNFEDLTDEELGKLTRHFYKYINDLNPILEDRLLKIAWKPIETTLKRDLKKWEQYIEKQASNGRKGGRPPKPKESQETQRLNNKPKKADSVSVSDIDSVNVNGIDKKENIKEKTPTAFSFFNSLISLGCDKDLANDWLKVRKTKKATNTKTAFDGFRKELDKSDLEINEVIRKCIENDWRGFKSDWLKENKPEIKQKINPADAFRDMCF